MIHPITAYRSRFYIWWLIWLLAGAGQSLLLLFVTDIGPLAAFTDGLLSSVLFSLLAIAIWFPVKQLIGSSSRNYIIVVNHLIIGVITILIWLFSVKIVGGSIIGESEAYQQFWDGSFYYRIGVAVFIYAVVILTYYLMISIDDINRKNMREANLERMLRETELMMLRSQINPHFLFNSLNSISSLTITDPSKAREMVIHLSEFMRYALSRKEEKIVPLRTEFENLRLYLGIEKVRFGDKLVIEEEISDDTLDTGVPTMILQPLYENAIKHGVYESTEKVVIKIETFRAGKGITIRISNDYDPESIPVRGTGTGLSNVSRRLDLYYNREAVLNTRKEKSKFIVEIYIPGKKEVKI